LSNNPDDNYSWISMTNVSGRKRWKVKARLEMKDVDLADSSKIHVSLK